MAEHLRTYIEYCATGVEILGVAIIVGGIIYSLLRFVFASDARKRSYESLKRDLGKAILLGLEVLIAGDIIATVVTKPTFDRVITLAIIVLIRTFLSFSIRAEIGGRFPWKQGTKGNDESL